MMTSAAGLPLRDAAASGSPRLDGRPSVVIRPAAVGEMTAHEAPLTLVESSRGPAGRPASLSVAGRVVVARRFDVPVTAVEPALPVSVVGRRPFPVPGVEVAGEAPWRAPRLDQTETARIGR